MHQEQFLEKTLWILHYNNTNSQASHIKLFYAVNLEDARMQVEQFIKTADDIVNEQSLEPMPSGFSIAFRFFPGKVQASSDGSFHDPGQD